MTTTFDRAINFVLDQEGGLSDDPNDPGGLTQWGISQRSYPSLDIRKLTREDAIGVYKRDFWDVLHCDALPPAIAAIVFDAGVNQGTRAAAQILQASVGAKQDGVIGPETLAAVASKTQTRLIAELVARRLTAYAHNPLIHRYALGWFRRVAQIHQTALEMI